MRLEGKGPSSGPFLESLSQPWGGAGWGGGVGSGEMSCTDLALVALVVAGTWGQL